MKQPENTEIFESPLITFWFDEDGILYSNSKPVPATLEAMKESVAIVKKVLNGRKVCTIADNTNSKPPDKVVRDYLATEVSHLSKAIASVSDSPVGKIVVNLYLTLRPPPFPM